jgi:hypothetical protein
VFAVERLEDVKGKRAKSLLATYSPFGRVVWKEACFGEGGGLVADEHLCMGCNVFGCSHTARITFPRNCSSVLDFVALVGHVHTHIVIITAAAADAKRRGAQAEYGRWCARGGGAASPPSAKTWCKWLSIIMITVGQFPEYILNNPGLLYWRRLS